MPDALTECALDLPPARGLQSPVCWLILDDNLQLSNDPFEGAAFRDEGSRPSAPPGLSVSAEPDNIRLPTTMHFRFSLLVLLSMAPLCTLTAERQVSYLYEKGDAFHHELVRRINAPVENDADGINTSLDRLRTLLLSDRVAFFMDLHAERTEDGVTLQGSVERPEFKHIADVVLTELGFGPVLNEVRMVPDLGVNPDPFGVTIAPQVATWAQPDLKGAPMDEALYGEPVYLLEELPEAWLVKTAVGYWGYARKDAIRRVNRETFVRLLNAPKLTLLEEHRAGERTLPKGSRLRLKNWGEGENCMVILPDGDTIAIPKAQCRVSRREAAMKEVMTRARTYLDSPYRLGGRSDAAGIDCSGLVQECYRSVGFSLPRDAKQQYLAGELIPACVQEALLPGDALFFMNESGQVYHVALYAGNGEIIHAIGREVQIHSIRPGATNYFPRMREKYIGAKRFYD